MTAGHDAERFRTDDECHAPSCRIAGGRARELIGVRRPRRHQPQEHAAADPAALDRGGRPGRHHRGRALRLRHPPAAATRCWRVLACLVAFNIASQLRWRIAPRVTNGELLRRAAGRRRHADRAALPERRRHQSLRLPVPAAGDPGRGAAGSLVHLDHRRHHLRLLRRAGLFSRPLAPAARPRARPAEPVRPGHADLLRAQCGAAGGVHHPHQPQSARPRCPVWRLCASARPRKNTSCAWACWPRAPRTNWARRWPRCRSSSATGAACPHSPPIRELLEEIAEMQAAAASAARPS